MEEHVTGFEEFYLHSHFACAWHLPCLAYSSVLKMEAACSSETSIDFQQTTLGYILDNRTCFLIYSLNGTLFIADFQLFFMCI
jgi:hypothetical protein